MNIITREVKMRPRIKLGGVVFALLSTLSMNAWALSDDRMDNRDPKLGATNTTADCVHGGTGTSENLDCTRSKMNRHTNDTNAYNTDTGENHGAVQLRSDSPTVSPRDGMTAQSNTNRY